MLSYIKGRLAEIVVCICFCFGATSAILSGFLISDFYENALPLQLLLSAVFVFALYVFTYDRLFVGIGVFIGVVLAALLVFYAWVANPFADEGANSLFLFVVVSFVVTTACFLITRTKSGSFIGLAIMVFLAAGACFLQFPIAIVAFAAIVIGGLLMVGMRVFENSLKASYTGFISAWKYLGQIAVVVLAALVVSLGIYFAIIGPLNPPTQDLKLIEVLRQMNTFDSVGLSQTKHVFDPDLLSDGVTTDEETGNQNTEDGEVDDGKQQDPEANDINDDNDGNNSSSSSVFEQNEDLIEYLQSVTYESAQFLIVLIIVLVVLAIVAIFALKFWLRRHWHTRIEALDNKNAVINYYQFFLKRFAKTGFKRPANTTLLDYAQINEPAMERFEVDGVTFCTLTKIYIRALYGNIEPTQAERAMFGAFYGAFYKNMRHQIGTFSYIRKFFFL